MGHRTPLPEHTEHRDAAWAARKLRKALEDLPLRIDMNDDAVTVPYYTARHVVQLSLDECERRMAMLLRPGQNCDRCRKRVPIWAVQPVDASTIRAVQVGTINSTLRAAALDAEKPIYFLCKRCYGTCPSDPAAARRYVRQGEK